MIYEVCALVGTIILGILGLEAVFLLRSTRKLTDEAKQTLQTVNAHLPQLLQDVQAVTAIVKQTGEQVGGTVNEVAAGLEKLTGQPLRFVAAFIEAAKYVLELWKDIRRRHKEDPDC